MDAQPLSDHQPCEVGNRLTSLEVALASHEAFDDLRHAEAEKALRLAQAAIVADPAHTASYVALGDLYARQGQPEYARSYYDLALAIDPQDASALKAIAALGAPAQAAVNAP